MGYSRYIGRVGALAVMLGVGAAVAIPGVAWAEDGEDSAPSGGADASQESSTTDSDPSAAAGAGAQDSSAGTATGELQTPSGGGQQQSPAAEDDDEGLSGSSGVTVDLGSGVVVSSSGGSLPDPDEKDKDEVVVVPADEGAGAEPAGGSSYKQPESQGGSGSHDSAPNVVNVPAVETLSATTAKSPESSTPASATVPSPVEQSVPLVVVDETVVQTISSPDEVPSEPAPEPTTVLTTLFSPSVTGDPQAPVDTPLVWALLAASRREFGSDTPPVSAVEPGATGEVAASLTTNDASTLLVDDPDATIGTPDPVTGTVTGVIIPPPDPQNRKPVYTLVSAPTQGSFSFNKTAGAFTYTPTAAQRVLAGVTVEDDTVNFTVNVKYGTGPNTPVTVSVPVSPSTVADIGTVVRGEGAGYIAVTNTRAYVSNNDAKTVTVIDTITGTKIRDIQVSGWTTGVAVSADGSKLYVASEGDEELGEVNKVTVYNTVDDSVLATVNLGDGTPSGVALSPNGKTLYVSTAVYDPDEENVVNDQWIVKINTATNKTAGIVRGVGLVPGTIVVSPDSSKVYVISEVDDETTEDIVKGVFVFSSTATTARQISGIGLRPEAIALSPDGKYLYVGDYNDGFIDQIDTKTLKSVANFETAPESIDDIVVNKDNTLLMVMNAQTHAVDIYNLRDEFALIASIATDADTAVYFPDAALSPDGQQLYYTSDGALQIISLLTPNTAPVANGETVNAPGASGVVTGGVGVTDGDDDPLKYTVTEKPAKGTVVVNANGSFTYTPTKAAQHAAALNIGPVTTDTFKVEVTDGRRGFVTEEITVTILPANAAPVPKVSTPAPGATGVVNGSVTATDADKDALAYGLASATSAKGGTVTINSATGKFTYTPTVPMRHAAAETNADNTDTFTVTISDGHGAPVNVTVTVQIKPANAVPTKATVSLGDPNEGSGAIVGAVTVVDPDGDALSLSTGTTAPKKGSVVYNNVDKTFTYTPTVEARAAAAATKAPAAAKTDTFTVVVDDGHGGKATVTVKVNILATGNQNPENGAYTAGVPAAANGAVKGTASADDPDGNPRTYSGSQTTSKGSVTVAANGAFTYTPTAAARHAASVNGAGPDVTTDTFNVVASDGKGGQLTIEVSVDILPKNTAPVGKATVNKPNTTTGVVTGKVTATDADKDTVTIGPATVTSAKGGTVAVNADGTFTYTPTEAARSAAAVTGAPASAKTDTFNVTISDGFGGHTPVPVTVTIAPANDNVAPTGGTFTPTGQPNASTGAVTGTVSANDGNGDALTYVRKTNPAKGTVTVSSAGVITYTPTAAARHTASANTATPGEKQDTFQVTASDGRGGTVTFTVTVDISPKNTAPAATFTASSPNTTTGVVTGKVTATDADKDTVTLTGPVGGVSAKGGTVAFNSTTGSYTYTPTEAARAAAAQTGASTTDKQDTFTVTLNDAHSPNGTNTVTVTVKIAPGTASQSPAGVNGAPLSNAVVGSTGHVYQVIGQDNGSGVTFVVKVYNATGGLIGTSANIRGNQVDLPVVRDDGGIAMVTYDATATDTYVTVVNFINNQVTTNETTFEGSGALINGRLPGKNGVKYLVASYYDGTSHTFATNLSAGSITKTEISGSPTFGLDGSLLSLRVTGTPGNTQAKIVKIRPNGTVVDLTDPEFSLQTFNPVGLAGAADGTVYLTTVMQSTGTTKVLVFGPSSTSATTKNLTGYAVGDVIAGHDGSVYQLTSSGAFYQDLIVNEISGSATASSSAITTSALSSTVIGVAANGTLYVSIDSDELVVARPDGSTSVVSWDDNVNSSDIRIGDDNNAYYLSAFGDFAVITSSGTKPTPALGGSVVGLTFDENKRAYLQVDRGANFVVLSSTNGFASFTTSASIAEGFFDNLPIQAHNGIAYVSPGSLTSAVLTAVNAQGSVVAPIPNSGNSTLVGPVVFGANGTGYVAVQVGTEYDEDVKTEVWAVTATGATKLATKTGVPAATGTGFTDDSLSIGQDGKIYLTTVVIDWDTNESTTYVHIVSPTSVL